LFQGETYGDKKKGRKGLPERCFLGGGTQKERERNALLAGEKTCFQLEKGFRRDPTTEKKKLEMPSGGNPETSFEEGAGTWGGGTITAGKEGNWAHEKGGTVREQGRARQDLTKKGKKNQREASRPREKDQSLILPKEMRDQHKPPFWKVQDELQKKFGKRKGSPK